jgi:alcohol dehydrogenase (cytochrome c)
MMRMMQWGATVLLLLLPVAAMAQQSREAAGRQAYETRCVGCHGADGAGGGHGPGFLDLRRPRATSVEALRDLILKGIPEAGMPAFPLPADVATAIAQYVTVLRAPAGDHPTAGDPQTGARYFSGAGKCASCHRVNGTGGLLGPDLSGLARTRRLAQIEQALFQPGSLERGDRAVSLRLQNGTQVRGVVRYEGPADLGVHGMDGQFHSVAKADVVELSRRKSVMPAVKAAPATRRDLLAFLTRLEPSKSSPVPAQQAQPEKGIAFADIAKPREGEWPTYHGNLSGNRHSPLRQIDTTNVTQLAPKWIFSIPGGGSQRPLQTTPVVVDGLMYVTAVNQVWALDARTGREVWHFGRPRTQGLVGDAAGGINRGVAVLGDRVFLQTDNAHLLALDRLTGTLLWETQMADARDHYGATGAPLVVNDLVIAGVSGGDEGVRGFLDAYKAATGERVWRFWTVPAPGEPGSETWQGNAWSHGCAATWLTGSYDPQAGLLYWPTGNPCPDYDGDQRKGDNLYSDSVLALDPATGAKKWHFQFTPHDLHDWDATESLVLVDAKFRGRDRKLLLQGNRNGFFYVLDRITGEFLLAEPFVKRLTWASGIGPDGRPKLIAGYQPTPQGALACPSVAGASNWPSTAYSPDTGLFYLMAQESCTIYTKRPQEWERGSSFYGGTTRRAPNEPSQKFLRALDIQTGRIAWEIPVEGGILESGLMTTAGRLVFYGDGSGAFVAADARSGKLLWTFQTGMGWKAGPMTYTIRGKQYIGVAAGSTVMVFGLP